MRYTEDDPAVANINGTLNLTRVCRRRQLELDPPAPCGIGFRSAWGAEVYADICSVVATGDVSH